MNEEVKQPYKDIREKLKDNNFNSVVMEAFELMCGEIVEMDLQFDNYPMAHTKYLETETSKKSVDFSKKYHGTSVVVKLALEQREELLKWKDSQQDLIKGKDEYIAKLCNDRTELKDLCKEYQNKNISLIDENTQLIGKNNSLDFENKSLKKELNDLREFAKIVATKGVDSLQAKSSKDDYDYNNWIDIGEYAILSKREFYLVKKVVDKYGKIN